MTDRIWMGRVTGKDDEPGPLNRLLHTDFAPLIEARLREDSRLVQIIEDQAEAAFAADVHYANMAGQRFVQPLGEIWAHLFNHQAHHRGQIHTALSLLTGAEPPSLDLILFHRGMEAPSKEAILESAR